jgi:hypothetical protein
MKIELEKCLSATREEEAMRGHCITSLASKILVLELGV